MGDVVMLVQDVRPTWQGHGIAMVCEKCCRERFFETVPEARGDERLELKDYLKDRLKDAGLWKQARVVWSSCLDVCAPGMVTVAIDASDTAGGPEVFVCDPRSEREAVYDRIVSRLGLRKESA